MEGERGQALRRAALTFASVLESHRPGHNGLFRNRTFGWKKSGYEALWPIANGWSAVCALASLDRSPTNVAALSGFFRSLARYSGHHGSAGLSSTPRTFLRHGGEVFFDDNAWIGLALLRHFRVTEDQRSLVMAGQALDFVQSGWSDDDDSAAPGGIKWKQGRSSRSRNTCSNGPTAELAVALYLCSGDEPRLEQSLRIYHWVRRALLDGDLYADHICPTGEVDRTVWSYNQGSMIGAGILLHQATGGPMYLDQATATARAALKRFSVPVLLTQEPAFNAIFFRNLALFNGAADLDFLPLAEAYSAAMWHLRRDGGTGLFTGQGTAFNNSMAMVEVDATVAGAESSP